MLARNKKARLQLVASNGSDRFRGGENTPAVPVGDKPHWGLRRRALGCHELDVATLLCLRFQLNDVLVDSVPAAYHMNERACDTMRSENSKGLGISVSTWPRYAEREREKEGPRYLSVLMGFVHSGVLFLEARY